MSQSDHIQLKKELAILSTPIIQQWTPDEYTANRKFLYETTFNQNAALTPNQLALSVNPLFDPTQPNYIKLFGMEKGYATISKCVTTNKTRMCPYSYPTLRSEYNTLVNHSSYLDPTKPNIAKSPIYNPKLYPIYKFKNLVRDCKIPSHHIQCNSTNTTNIKPSTYSKNIRYGFYRNTVF